MQSALAIPDWLLKAESPVRRVVEIGLVLILAVSAARVFWLVQAPQASVSILQDRPLPTPVSRTETSVTGDRSLLVRINPFETGGRVEIPEAPETQLNLRLAGLIMSTDAFGGSAQVATPDNQTNRYITGDEILPGVVLQRILSDRVILNRNGESETLMLSGRGEGLSVISDGSQVVEPGSVPEPLPPPSAPVESRIASPEILLSAISPTPIQRDGQFFGYQLSPRGSVDAMTAIGLVPGDVLLEINGTSVRTLAVDELMTEIGNGEVAVLRVERDGHTQIVRLRFNQG